MGLKLYYKDTEDQFVEISTDDDLSSPLMNVHDGKTGDIVTTQLYLRNDDAAKWFSNIIVQPVDLVDPDPYGDIAYSETGWGIKLSAGAAEPTSGEWEDIDWGNQINMSDIGSDLAADTTTYFPLWHLVTCPPNTEAQVKTDLVVNVGYTENAVI
jgi:hypothetical protein